MRASNRKSMCLAVAVFGAGGTTTLDCTETCEESRVLSTRSTGKPTNRFCFFERQRTRQEPLRRKDHPICRFACLAVWGLRNQEVQMLIKIILMALTLVISSEA